MTLYWYAIIVRYKYDYILLSYCSTLLEWRKIKECLYLSHSAASPALGGGGRILGRCFCDHLPCGSKGFTCIINCLNVSQIISTFQKPCICNHKMYYKNSGTEIFVETRWPFQFIYLQYLIFITSICLHFKMY